MIDDKELLRLLRSGCAVTPHQIQAADEIESLRGKIAFLREGGEKREARMKEMEQESIHNEGVMVALREGYTEALARVKELEEKDV